jgi:hypothetical protein
MVECFDVDNGMASALHRLKTEKGGCFVSVEVALGTYILPSDHKVWKFFPGKNYKFHDLVSETAVALIDVRNLQELGNDPTDWDEDDLLEHIADDRIERRVEMGAARPEKFVRSSGDKATLTFLQGLFFTAKKGDLIVMPDKGYTTNVRIGMLLDKPGALKTVVASDIDTNYRYYGRRVAWVGEIEKRKLSDALISQLHSQAAFFDLGRSHYEEIYDRAFDDYVYDELFVATFRTSKNIFTSKDSLLSSLWFELIEVLEEARDGHEELAIDNIYELAVESDINEDDRNDLSIYVQSPGWFRWRSQKSEPLAAIALFAMATANVPYAEAKKVTVSAQVIRQADSECLGDVNASVRAYLELLGKDRWEQACKLATKAKDQATLRSNATLKNEPKNAKHRK